MPNENNTSGTPEQETPLSDLSQTPIVEPEGGLHEAYSNVFNLNWTLHDVRVRFGELIQEPRDDGPCGWKDQANVIMERVAITMPWHQAKYLAVLLTGLVANYEKLNGELKQIKLPSI